MPPDGGIHPIGLMDTIDLERSASEIEAKREAMPVVRQDASAAPH
jgi:hypothetical protein